MDWAVVLVVALVVVAVAGVLLLPQRKQWNADGGADAARARLDEPAEDDEGRPEP